MSNWIAYDTTATPPITSAEQENNVAIIANYFRSMGWTDNAIAAMCGNIQVESYINPGQFEHGKNFSPNYGFGLVQWTPLTKFSNWAGNDWRTNYDKQLARIQYELEQDTLSPDSLQWFRRHGYTETFKQFSESTQSVEYLTMCFQYCYENGTPFPEVRIPNAIRWYEYITGVPYKKPIPVWLLFKLRWNNFGG